MVSTSYLIVTMNATICLYVDKFCCVVLALYCWLGCPIWLSKNTRVQLERCTFLLMCDACSHQKAKPNAGANPSSSMFLQLTGLWIPRLKARVDSLLLLALVAVGRVSHCFLLR